MQTGSVKFCSETKLLGERSERKGRATDSKVVPTPAISRASHKAGKLASAPLYLPFVPPNSQLEKAGHSIQQFSRFAEIERRQRQLAQPALNKIASWVARYDKNKHRARREITKQLNSHHFDEGDLEAALKRPIEKSLDRLKSLLLGKRQTGNLNVEYALFACGLLSLEGLVPKRMLEQLWQVSQDVWRSRQRREAQRDLDGAIQELVFQASKANDAQAALALARTAHHTTMLANVLVAAHPEWFQPWARKQSEWPVLLSKDPKRLAREMRRLDRLQLGGDRMQIRGGRKTSSVRRDWARTVLNTLASNKDLCAQFKNVPGISWPKWVEDCETLPVFTRRSFSQWWAVALEMLKDQCDDLHRRPEWTKEGAWQRSQNAWNKNTPGRKRAAILEAIRQAMVKLAPS